MGAGLSGGVAGTAHSFVITARDVLGNLRGVTGDAWQVLALLVGPGALG